MSLNRNLDWLKESDNINLLEDDELDSIDEGLYVDSSNYGNYDDLVDVVDKEGNPQKTTQHTYNANKDSGEFTKKEPESQDDSSSQAFEVHNKKETNSKT